MIYLKDIINKTAFIADDTKKQTETTIKAFLTEIGNALATGDSVQIIGFGTFKLMKRNERKGRNPQTGEEITIPASKGIVFKPGTPLKTLVNK